MASVTKHLKRCWILWCQTLQESNQVFRPLQRSNRNNVITAHSRHRKPLPARVALHFPFLAFVLTPVRPSSSSQRLIGWLPCRKGFPKRRTHALPVHSIGPFPAVPCSFNPCHDFQRYHRKRLAASLFAFASSNPQRRLYRS